MLFDRQVARKPDNYPWTRNFIEAMHEGFWTVKKFTFDSDKTDFELNLTEQERQIVTRCLAAIAQIEVKVKEFWARLGQNLPHPSMTDMGIVMANVEVIHNNAYERLLEVLDMEDVFEKNMNVPAISGRVGYLTKHMEKVYGDDRKQYVYSLVLFTLFVENVSLFSQFYVLLWLNRYRNVLKDTAQQVKYTRNEELLHGQAGSKIINTLRSEYPELFDEDLEARIVEECDVAYAAECNLIDWMLEDYSGENIDARLLKSYVAERLNESMVSIGYRALYQVQEHDKRKTFWMTEGLLAPSKVDFFHSEPTAYTQADTPDDDNF